MPFRHAMLQFTPMRMHLLSPVLGLWREGAAREKYMHAGWESVLRLLCWMCPEQGGGVVSPSAVGIRNLAAAVVLSWLIDNGGVSLLPDEHVVRNSRNEARREEARRS